MKILIVTQYFWPENFRINDIALSLIEDGHEVEVYTGMPNYPAGTFYKGYGIQGPYEEVYKKIKIIRTPLVPRGKGKGWQLAVNYLSFCLLSCLLLPRILFNKYDRVFIYQLSPVTAALPGIILGRIRKIPTFLWVTDLWPETLEAVGVVKSNFSLKVWGSFVTFLYEKSDAIFVSSKGFIDKIKQRGININKIKYWPYWSEEIFCKKELEKKPLNLPVGFKILFAGNIGSSQSFETLLKAAKLLKSDSDIKWIILGDGNMREWLEKEIEKEGLGENVILLGQKPLEMMPAYFSQVDVLFAALRKGSLFSITLPSKIQNYLPAGKPLLLSMDGEGPEMIRNAEAGLTAGAEDFEALALAAKKLKGMSSAERSQMGRCAFDLYEKEFTRSHLSRKLSCLMSLGPIKDVNS